MDDELKHVGVLGMKWGRRNAEITGEKLPFKKGTKFTFQKEGRKTVVRNQTTGRKLTAGQQKKFMKALEKSRQQRIKDIESQAKTATVVGAVLGTLGTIALWKHLW